MRKQGWRDVSIVFRENKIGGIEDDWKPEWKGEERTVGRQKRVMERRLIKLLGFICM